MSWTISFLSILAYAQRASDYIAYRLSAAPSARPNPTSSSSFIPTICCLLQVWSAKVSDLLDHKKDWVYLHPDTSRSSSASLSPSRQPSEEFDRSQRQSRRMDPSTGTCDSGGYETERRQSPWVEEHRHVAEWAEFLWRVARPGVNPYSVLDEQVAGDGAL